MTNLPDGLPSGPVTRTKSNALWVAGMVAVYIRHKADYDASGITLLWMVGEPNIDVANRIYDSYQSMTPDQAAVVADANLDALTALLQVPAQRQYPAGVTA